MVDRIFTRGQGVYCFQDGLRNCAQSKRGMVGVVTAIGAFLLEVRFPDGKLHIVHKRYWIPNAEREIVFNKAVQSYVENKTYTFNDVWKEMVG